MGLWGSSAPTLPTPKTSTDGAPIAPDRSQRAKCWEGREAYFACLDKNGIVDSITESGKAEKFCGAEGKVFAGTCAESWVTYFKKKRVMEYQKEKTMERLRAENAQMIPGEVGPGAGGPGGRP